MSSKKQIIEVDTLPEDIVAGTTYSINQTNPNTYTHGMFKYPCKFIPEIPRWAIKNYIKYSGNVFDPFAGSGTTALETVLSGNDAYSTEIDDIAKLIITVKTTKLKQEEFDALDDFYEMIMSNIHNKHLKIVKPEINNLEHWFPEESTLKLGRIKKSIEVITNISIKNFFNVCFVSIIKKVSFADDTSPKPYVSNKIKKIPPIVEKEFSNIYHRYKKMEYELMQVDNIGKSKILIGNALDFSLGQKIDLAITSPPYINAFDYGRTMRLENIWLGTLTEEELCEKKREYVGTERIDSKKAKEDISILEKSNLLQDCYSKIIKTDEKRALIVKKFFDDIEKNLIKVYSSLKKDGRYMIVIGNSSIRKINVESWKIIEQLSHNIGYDTETFFSYEIRNSYIRIPRHERGGKINKDHIIVLKKKV